MGLGRSTTWWQRMSQLLSHNDTVTAFPPSPDWADFLSYDLPALCRTPCNPTTTIVDTRGSPNRYSLSLLRNSRQSWEARIISRLPPTGPIKTLGKMLWTNQISDLSETRGEGRVSRMLSSLKAPETLVPCTSVSLFCRPEKIKSFCNQVGVVGGLGGGVVRVSYIKPCHTSP